jgi:ABC-type phosphate transport system permease subunit
MLTNNMPSSMKESLALGASKWQRAFYIICPFKWGPGWLKENSVR